MALSQDTPIKHELGGYIDYDVLTLMTIYEGSMIGEDAATGYVRALVAGDPFLGHAIEAVDNSAGASGAERVRVLAGEGTYKLQVTLTGIAITNLGEAVYASDDGTITLTAGGNSYLGFVSRYVSANTCVVEFCPMASAAKGR